MENENKQDGAEPSPASTGSVAGRVALFDSQQQALFRQWITSPAAGYVRQNLDGTPYHHSQPTLTDAERAVLLGVAEDARYRGAEYTEQAVRGLLDRLG